MRNEQNVQNLSKSLKSQSYFPNKVMKDQSRVRFQRNFIQCNLNVSHDHLFAFPFISTICQYKRLLNRFNLQLIPSMIGQTFDHFFNLDSQDYQDNLQASSSYDPLPPEDCASQLVQEPHQLDDVTSQKACHSGFISINKGFGSQKEILVESNSKGVEGFQISGHQIENESTEAINPQHITMEDIDLQSDQEEDQPSNGNGNPVQKKSRPKDENNAHKKFQTEMNKLISSKIKKFIRQNLQRNKMKNEKSQRYGFVIRMIDLIKATSMEYVVSRQNLFSSSIRLKFLGKKDKTEDNSYLEKLVSVYERVYQLFVEGRIQEAVQHLYRFDNSKHHEYEKRGMKRVQERLSSYQ